MDEKMTGPETFEAAVRAITSGLCDLLIRKQRDYGKGNVQEFGLIGLIIRANDKLSRIKKLSGVTDGSFQPKSAQNESLEDSFYDLAGYAVLALLFKNGAFDLPYEKK